MLSLPTCSAARNDRLPELSPDALADLLRRVDTSGLHQGDTPTVALIVVNTGERDVPEGVAEFSARFSVRASVGAQAVTVRDANGNVVPSRIAFQSLTPDPALPPDRVWWTLRLQFVVANVFARGWRSYGAAYGRHLDSDAPAAFWDRAAAPDASALDVYETNVHTGDLPAAGCSEPELGAGL